MLPERILMEFASEISGWVSSEISIDESLMKEYIKNDESQNGKFESSVWGAGTGCKKIQMHSEQRHWIALKSRFDFQEIPFNG